MGSTLPEILQPGVINRIVSELKVTNDRLQKFFSTGGTNPVGGRNYGWDIFNETREIAQGRAPDTGPAFINPQPVAIKTGVFPRSHELVHLSYEKIHNFRKQGGVIIDKRGEDYILKQERTLAQRQANYKEFQYMGMIRGKYFHNRIGDEVKVSLTTGQVEIGFDVPTGNQGTLDMLGEGAIIAAGWNLSATPIVDQLVAINRAFEVLSGRALNHIWLNSVTMGFVQDNDQMISRSGSANVVFNSNGRVLDNDFEIVMKAAPWITFHVTDGLLTINGTAVPLFDDNEVLFCPTPDSDWIEMQEGSEVVVEEVGMEGVERMGSYFWAAQTTKPAGYELLGVWNGTPALMVPNNIAFGDVS